MKKPVTKLPYDPVTKLPYDPLSASDAIKALKEEKRQNKMSVVERRKMNTPKEPEAVHRGMEVSRRTGGPLRTSVLPPSETYEDPYDPSGWNPTPININTRRDWENCPRVRWSDDPAFRERWHLLFYLLASLQFLSLCLVVFMYLSRPTLNMPYQNCST